MTLPLSLTFGRTMRSLPRFARLETVTAGLPLQPVLKGVRSSHQAQAGVGERTPWEVFYACPSASVVAFLDAAASLAPSADVGADSGAAALQTLSELASATQVSCSACSFT